MENVHPLKTYRARAKLTQKALADLAGVTRETIARLEGGTRAPSLTLAARLSEKTGIPIDKFVKVDEAAQ